MAAPIAGPWQGPEAGYLGVSRGVMGAPDLGQSRTQRGMKGPLSAMDTPRPMSEDEIKSAVSAEIQDAFGNQGSQIAEERRRALHYYYGRPFGNEIEGRSQVVLTEVRDTIQWMMPTLMNMLADSEQLWTFEATSEMEEPQAREATLAVNHLFFNQCNGYMVLWEWIMAALMEKNSIVKPEWVDVAEPKLERYFGLDELAIGSLISQEKLGNIKIVELGEHRGGENVIDMATGAPRKTYDITLRRTASSGQLKVYGVPGEEYLHSRRSIRLDDETPFSAHVQKKTVSQLIAEGFPPEVILRAPRDEMPEYSIGRTTRLSEDETYPQMTTPRTDKASQELWLHDCYVRMDVDGDGYAELRRIIVVGEHASEILYNEPVNFNPLTSLCPTPMPYKFYGESVADAMMDLQLIRSTMLRNVLDNIYHQNNATYEVVEGQVNYDDILTTEPGGSIRVTAPGSVTPLVTPPLPPATMAWMEYLEGVGEKRTGVSRWISGPDASDLKHQTDSGISQVRNAASGKIRQIAKIFAKTGIKELGHKILRLLVENASGAQRAKISGQWVSFDPSRWNTKMACSVNVGLGDGERHQRLQQLMMVAELQEKALKDGASMMVTPAHLYNTAQDIQEALGFKRQERYFKDPGDQPFPPPEPDFDEQVRIAENKRRVDEQAKKYEIDRIAQSVEETKNADLNRYRFAELAQKREVEMAKMALQQQLEHARIAAQERIAAAQRQSAASAAQRSAA